MATVNENLKQWNNYDWDKNGDEWSEGWGGSDYLWALTILPRITKNIPCSTILEIACGKGRISQYLLKYCKKLILVDICQSCIDYCKVRFKDYNHIEYIVNDGISLDMISDNSIDFVFSWDSLVHADKNVIQNYISELSKKMKSNAIGFIHHSNYRANKNLNNSNIKIFNSGWRAEDMCANDFKKICIDSSLVCKTQEVFRGSNLSLSDCISYFYKPSIKSINKDIKTNVFINKHFIKEVMRSYGLSLLYNSPQENKIINKCMLSFDNMQEYLVDISLNRDLYFWGISSYFDNVYNYYLNEIGIKNITGLIDRDSKRFENSNYQGLPVFAPNQIFDTYKEKDKKPFIIITTYNWFNDISKTLEKKGYSKYENYLPSLYFW